MRWILVIALMAAPLLGWAGGSGAGSPSATKLTFREPAFHDPQVQVATSMPPQFEVVLTRDMPTPGWTLDVDEVAVDAKAGRILVRITEVAPGGIRTQVITPTPCHVPLGRLEPGVFSLELWLRRGDGPHVLAQVLVVRAR